MNRQGGICTKIGLLLLAAALALFVYNLASDALAGASANSVLKQLDADSGILSGSDAEAASIPEYILNPEMDMPEKVVDGRSYIGVLEMPALSLELPVISEWSSSDLNVAPCRYAGSAYSNNLVIAAHNYRSHFGRLDNLSPGDEVVFTDVDGNVFRYEVIELETLSSYASDEMVSGDWDLTLFTCTLSGQQRITVRCESESR